jgi:hypothetical protein
MPRGRWPGAEIAAGATVQRAQPGWSLGGHRRRYPVCRGDDLLFSGHPVGRLRPRRPRDDGAHDGPGRDDGTRSAATQRLCHRFGGHGVDHAAEPASGRSSRSDESGRYSWLAVGHDAGPAGRAHLGQSHPNAGPVRRPRLCGGGAGRLGRGARPRPAHPEGLPGLSRLDSQGPVEHRAGLRRTAGPRSRRAGRSRHHHLAVPRIRTVRSGPRDQHQHQASRAEPHR